MSSLRTLFYFPPGTEMFYFPGFASNIKCLITVETVGLPHSEISGSKVARHLPEAYRSYATSFIAFLSQGIHHILLNFLLGNLKTTIFFTLNESFDSLNVKILNLNPLHRINFTRGRNKSYNGFLLLLYLALPTTL